MPGKLEIDNQIRFATVSYLANNLAVECIFDENEAWVEVKIARVKSGLRPADYSTDSDGNRVRESLYPLLIKRGVREFGPRERQLSAKPLNEMFRIRLSKDAELIKKYGQKIVEDSPVLLDSY